MGQALTAVLLNHRISIFAERTSRTGTKVRHGPGSPCGAVKSYSKFLCRRHVKGDVWSVLGNVTIMGQALPAVRLNHTHFKDGVKVCLG
jgi:hypothetical protein